MTVRVEATEQAASVLDRLAASDDELDQARSNALEDRIDLIVGKICSARNHLVYHLFPFFARSTFRGDHCERMAYRALFLDDGFSGAIRHGGGARRRCSGYLSGWR